MLKSWSRFLPVLCLLLGSSVVSGADIKVIEASAGRFVFEFSPEKWTRDDVVVEMNNYQVFSFYRSEAFGPVGQPQIPTRVLTFGCPQDGTVDVRVVDTSYETIRDVEILPLPQEQRRNGEVTALYSRDEEIYGRPVVFPETIWTQEEPVMFRNQWIFRLCLRPLQVLPAEKSVKKYTRIVVQIDFHGTDGRAVKIDSRDEDLYRDLLVNYEQAKRWRLPVSGLQKTGARRFDGDNWYKLIIRGDGRGGKEGIYKVDGAVLAGAGVSLESIDPATLQLFNNGGLELPRDAEADRPLGLIENPIRVVGGEDGTFSSSDYILFYGRSLEGFYCKLAGQDSVSGSLSHYIHPYSYENVYWLTFGKSNGKRMASQPSLAKTGLTAETSFRDLVFIEEERSNILSSGVNWVGAELAADKNSVTMAFSMPGAVASERLDYRSSIAIATGGSHGFSTYLNEFLIGEKTLSGYYSGYALRTVNYTSEGVLLDGDNTLRIEYNVASDVAFAYIDWVELEYGRRFEAVGDQLLFYSPIDNRTCRYDISGFTRNDIQVYDVTDIDDIRTVLGTEILNGVVSFAAETAITRPRRYLAVTPSAYKTVSEIQRTTRTDLRQARYADYIIITHEDLYQPALQLESLRENWSAADRLETEIVKISDIYDEFACGIFDPTAIRDFLAYAQENWGDPRYVLLLGDGHYDYKNIRGYGEPNLIPPYESEETIEDQSRTTDDWYTYTRGADAGMQMAIGRLTVQTVDQAQSVINKIVTYETKPEYGEWQKTITLVADDELAAHEDDNEYIHTNQSETLAERHLTDLFVIKKIYLIDYPIVRTASVSGRRKPLAADALIEQINRGSLVINYIGHGNDELWAHEQVLNGPTDFDRIQNGDRMALWVAATCEFAHWDQPDKQSLAERLITVQNRGAVALVSSARLAYSLANASFNYALFDGLFESYESTGLTRRIGDAVLLAKRSIGNRVNSEKFGVFGDPAMRLGAPRYRAIIDSIEPDSIEALRKITIHGHVEDEDALWEDYDGNVLVRVFDSRIVRTYVTARGSDIDYTVLGNGIFRGVVPITSGRFDVEFIVPKDISYGGSDGRISVYFWSETNNGSGVKTGLPVGGTAVDLVDNTGPEIEVHFGQSNFAPGDYTSPDPVLHVGITDSLSGVNIAGDIGHQITMTLDDNYGETRDITEFFEYDKGSYVSGRLKYNLYDLDEGDHGVQVKAWDNSNNSAIAETRFTVVTESELQIRNLLNYPNPITESTSFTFELSQDAEVTLKIYSVSGRLLKKFEPHMASIGFNLFPVVWDCTDQDGDVMANGVYLYKLVARTDRDGENVTEEKIGKLVIAR